MKTSISIIRSLQRGLLLGIALLAGCGVTEPDEAAWTNVAAYSWPADTAAFMRYRVEKIAERNFDTSDITTRISSKSFRGEPMFELVRKNQQSQFNLRFLPLQDTLVTQGEKFPAEYALVAPLVKGHSWICGYQVNSPWRATILERYAYRKIEGRVYKNVIEVEYKPTVDPVQESWIRFYAEGIGPVQTTKHNILPLVDTLVDVPTLRPYTREVLISTSARVDS